MYVEGVTPGVVLVAEGDLRPALALTPLSPPGHGPAPLDPVPAAALAPTHDPGVLTHTKTHIYLITIKFIHTHMFWNAFQ